MDIVSDELIAGVDEAGRGPLAGPVFAAAVILHPGKKIEGLNDSKKLSEKERDRLFIDIRQKSLAWSYAKATVKEIDELNILKASLLAMKRAVLKLKLSPNLVLIDGNQYPDLLFPMKAIVNGDALEPAISAASIVAKVLRDKLMKVMDKKYPGYEFGKHKGYATKQHLSLLKHHGPSPIHRKTFSPVTRAFKII